MVGLRCSGAEFLKKYGHDGQLNWYFALDREGQPLVEPYNIFSYTFAVIAFGQLAIATGTKSMRRLRAKPSTSSSHAWTILKLVGTRPFQAHAA